MTPELARVTAMLVAPLPVASPLREIDSLPVRNDDVSRDHVFESVLRRRPEVPDSAAIAVRSASAACLPARSVVRLVTADCGMLLRVLSDPEIVLLVRVWVPVRVATVESIERVTAPDVPPPLSHVPAVTPVMSPTW